MGSIRTFGESYVHILVTGGGYMKVGGASVYDTLKNSGLRPGA